MLAYNVWTEEDCKSRNLVDEGIYNFVITNVVLKKTKGGFDKDGNNKPIRDMIEIDFEYLDNQNTTKRIKDWIVFMEGMDYKLRYLADSIGKLDLYEERVLDCHHLLNQNGSFKIAIKEVDDVDRTKKKINFVKEYLKKETKREFPDVPF